MSIELSTNNYWFSDKGTTLKLFEQLLLFLDSTTPIGQKIFLLDKVSIDGLNLSDSDENNQLHFKDTLDKVLAYNQEQQGADLYDAAGFPYCYKKLLELKQLLEEVDDSIKDIR